MVSNKGINVAGEHRRKLTFSETTESKTWGIKQRNNQPKITIFSSVAKI